MDAVKTKNHPVSRLPLHLSLLALGALTALSTAAEERIFFSSLPLVASVSRLPQQLSETPASVTIIDQEMIRTSGMRTVEDLLRLVPGFQVTSHNQDPAIVAYHGLNYGLSNEEYGPRVQVLVDGRSQYSPLFKSGVNWNLLPVALENIERIEVIRGANTVSYGSNAFMGVINIITMDPALTKGWMVSANHGNNGIRDEVLRWGAVSAMPISASRPAPFRMTAFNMVITAVAGPMRRTIGNPSCSTCGRISRYPIVTSCN